MNFHDKFQAFFLDSKIRKIIQNPEKFLSKFNIKEKMAVADIGCGTGFFTISIAKIVKNEGLVYAIDVSDYMLKKLEKKVKKYKIKNVKIIKSSAENLKEIKDESVDLSLVLFSLHHFNDKLASIKEILRITKKRGEIYILDPLKKRLLIHGLKEKELNEILNLIKNHEIKISRKKFNVEIKIKKLFWFLT